MTTYTNSNLTDHTSDAGMRVWIDAFLNGLLNGAFSAAGTIYGDLAQTADTGQMTSGTLASATRPSTNTAIASNGYVIVKLDDTNVTAAPFFIKFEFGTGSASTVPAIWVTIGTGSNGSGTITGIWQTRTQYSFSANSTVTNYAMSVCCVDGFLGIAYMRAGGLSTSYGLFFMFSRTVDTSGVADDRGAAYLANIANSGWTTANSYSYTTTAVAALAQNSCHTYGLTSTLVTGVAQVFRFEVVIANEVLPLVSLMLCLNAEIGTNSTPTATLVGATSHTYLAMFPNASAQTFNVSQTIGWNLCMLWE